jgi:hypothetical protein
MVDMKEMLDKKALGIEKKETTFTKISREKDIDNKQRELRESEWTYKNAVAEKKNLEDEQELFVKISDLMLKHYGKVPDKIDNLWEGQEEYWSLMKEKQKIDNKRRLAQFEASIIAADRKIVSTKEHIENLNASIEMVREELDEMGDEE